jgi:hypothetical protein
MSFEFLQVNRDEADKNIAYAKSKIIQQNLPYEALFTQEMANIPITNIATARGILSQAIQEIQLNYNKAKVSDRIPAGVARQCPPGWTDDGAAICYEPFTEHPCPPGWTDNGLLCQANYYYDPCPPGTDRIGDFCHHPMWTEPLFCKRWGGIPGLEICLEYGGGQTRGGQSDHSPVRGGQTEPQKITGGRAVGKMNLPQDGGDLLRCPADRPDYIDGLCYASCPAYRPYHLNGMPYLCVGTQDVGKLIRDEWNFQFVKAPQAQEDIACLEGIRDNDHNKIKDHCGANLEDYWKGWGEEIAANTIGFVSLGLSDMAAMAGAPVWDKIFGHQPYGDSDQKHAEGVVSAMASAKYMSKQKACLDAINSKNFTAYTNYCDLFAPELLPDGTVSEDKKVAILPTLPEVPDGDVAKELYVGINYDQKWIDEQIPVVPVIDESKLPPYPAWVATQPSPEGTPPGKKNMLKKQPPRDMSIPMAVGLAALIFLLG